MTNRPEILLADADVLIDYRDSDLSILRLVSENIGSLKVLTLVHEQVKGLSERKCRGVGIEVVEPDLDELAAAGQWEPRVGFVDAVCVATALARRWTLVTNDQALRSVSADEGVALRRGLGLMVDLVRTEVLTRRRALRVARAMQQLNPIHLNEKVISLFERALEEE